MNTRQSKTDKVRLAVKRYPYLIPAYLKPINGFNPKITMGIMSSMLPYRSSVEIECINSLRREKIDSIKDNKREFKAYYYRHFLHKKFNVNKYDDDFGVQNNMSEHRIDIINYKQLLGLYNILTEMNKVCKLNPDSGIHIHIDISHLNIKGSNSKFYEALQEYLETRLDDVYAIFDSCYTGIYNARGVTINQKSAWVNIRSQLNSVEFRIGYCTFEYTKIIEWMIACNKIITDAKIHMLKLGLISTKPINKKKYNSNTNRIAIRNRNNQLINESIGLLAQIS